MLLTGMPESCLWLWSPRDGFPVASVRLLSSGVHYSSIKRAYSTRAITTILTSTPSAFINGSLIYRANLCPEKTHAYTNDSVHAYPHLPELSPFICGKSRDKALGLPEALSVRIRLEVSAVSLSLSLWKIYRFLTKHLLNLNSSKQKLYPNCISKTQEK